LSRGVAGDENHLATTTGPCDAIFASSQVEDRYGVDYFFFRRFVFFAVFFDAAFAFLFFAIAALLA
jgi:hypothetical protein